jgi:hypothetical protein
MWCARALVLCALALPDGSAWAQLSLPHATKRPIDALSAAHTPLPPTPLVPVQLESSGPREADAGCIPVGNLRNASGSVEHGQPVLTVRHYVPLPAKAMLEVERIFDHAGISIRWATDGPHGLILLVRPLGKRSDVTGRALVHRETGRGTVAYIYTDNVARLATARAFVEYEALLGRAIAHELGHLLGLKHGLMTVGVMRPSISGFENKSRQDWLFHAKEVARLRNALCAGEAAVPEDADAALARVRHATRP